MGCHLWSRSPAATRNRISVAAANAIGARWILLNILKPFIYVFLVLAALGFLCTLVIYLGAFAHLERLDQILMRPLIPGLFIVWFATVLVMTRMTRFGNRRDVWKIALSGCPIWLRRTLYGVIGFGMLNFVYFVVFRKQETVPAALFMGGHFMMFYGVAFCVMYSAIHAPALLANQTCSLGHVVAPLDRYCPTCGNALHAQPACPSK